jgi:flagellar hook-associated protein 3 FlgL
MRITSAHGYDASIANLQQRQQDMSDQQTRLTSGKRVLKASDDPVAAARAERAMATIERSKTDKAALDSSKNAMTLSESALGDANDLLQQIRESLVAAGNATYSDSERKDLGNKIAGLRNQLLAVANRDDGAGSYLFGGQGASQPPFLDAAGGVQYKGTSGQTMSSSSESLPMTVDGQASWLQARSGNGVFVTAPTAGSNSGGAWVDAGHVTDPGALTGSSYSVQFTVANGATTYSVLQDGNPTSISGASFVSGQAINVDGISFTINGKPADGDQFQATPSTPSLNVFNTLDSAIAQLKTPLRSTSAIQQGVQSGLRDLDQSMSSLQSLRSAVGQSLNLNDSAQQRASDLKLFGETEQSNATDLDMVSAISDFQNKQSSYDAALKTYSLVQKMSLFNYISGS